MNFRVLLFFSVSIFIGCKIDKPKKQFTISKLYIGFNNLEAFRDEKKDSLKFIPPPPPPLGQEIANNNIIEDKDGKVYFYSFPMKYTFRGCIQENERDFAYELFMEDLDTLQSKNMQTLHPQNLSSLMLQLSNNKEKILMSIGIQKDSTTNELLLKITNLLYQNSAYNIWKVRRISHKEQNLLNQKKSANR